MYRSRKQGFIELRTIVALLVTMTILPLLITVFKFISDFNFDYDLVNNEVALTDLRRILLISYDMSINESELNFIYHNNNYRLSLVNNKLILQPGTQIYLNNIEDAYFFTRNGSIYVAYTNKDGSKYERNIGKEKGIYLDDFLDNNDEQYNSNNGDE